MLREKQEIRKTEKDEYSILKLLFLLHITGGILYSFLSASVFTVMVAASRIIPFLRHWAGTVFIAMMIFGVFFALVMTISILMRKELLPFMPTRKIWMGYLVKASTSVAKRLGMDPDKAVRSFIQINNEFVIKAMKSNSEPSNILILLPHCIQLNSCVFKITSDINNCRKCGKCVISSFIELSERFSFDVFVSTGGTMARKVIKERMPDLILAVACERDLLSGIKDTLNMPVIGILNERPNGPCYNTTVDPSAIEVILNRLYSKNTNLL